MRQTAAVIAALLLIAGVAACVSTTAPGNQNQSAVLNAHSGENGSASQRPVYYDAKLFTVNMMELSDAAAAKLAHNPGLNEIYAYADLDEVDQPFNSIIDAIPGDGMNPLWQQQLIVFNPGFTPRQFFSDDEVNAAAEGANPEITLVDTHELYRCSVVQQKQ